MLNNRTESDARQYPSRSNSGKKKKGNSVKWSRKSIIFSPFCYRVSYFLVNIFATREPASLSNLFLFRRGWPRLKWRSEARWNSCGTIISGRWSCGTRCTRKHPPDQLDRITGPYPGTGSIFQLNIPAMYIWRIACFRLVLAFMLKCYKSTVEFRLKAIGE